MRMFPSSGEVDLSQYNDIKNNKNKILFLRILKLHKCVYKKCEKRRLSLQFPPENGTSYPIMKRPRLGSM